MQQFLAKKQGLLASVEFTKAWQGPTAPSITAWQKQAAGTQDFR